MSIANPTLLHELGNYFRSQPDIRLAIVFGSVASDRTLPESDLDVAVLGLQRLDASRRLEVMAALARISGRAVDLVDLASAGVHIRQSVLRHGKVIFATDEQAYPEQITRMLLDSADFLPYRERILEERRRAWLG